MLKKLELQTQKLGNEKCYNHKTDFCINRLFAECRRNDSFGWTGKNILFQRSIYIKNIANSETTVWNARSNLNQVSEARILKAIHMQTQLTHIQKKKIKPNNYYLRTKHSVLNIPLRLCVKFRTKWFS